MKFLKLEILHLASLDRPEGETINFEEGALGDSTIFSIIGPTGSGKSTLLDAICLALYNRAPRYPKKKNDRKQGIEIYGQKDEKEKNRIPPTDARNILTRGKKNGYSKLTFQANNDNVYRAEWHVRFLTKRFDNVETHLYAIKTDNGHQIEEEAVWDDLPQIIGLDYEQFLRTVLIAQGSFANFLTADEEERYQLLEKLVGCEEMYTGIADRIAAKKSEVTEAYKQMASDFKAYEKDIVPDEELAALAEQIGRLEAAEKKAKEELAQVTEALAWFAAEEKFAENIARYRTAFDEARRRMDEMKPAADRLALHDSTLEATSLLKDVRTCERKIADHDTDRKKLEAEAATNEQAISDEQKSLAALQEAATQANAELEKQKPHIGKAREIKTQLQELAKTAKEKNAAKAAADKALKQAQDAAKQNAAGIKKAEEELENATKAREALAAKQTDEEQRLKEKVTTAAGSFDAENKKLEGADITRLQEAKTLAERKDHDLTNAIRIQASLAERLKSQAEDIAKQKQLTDRNGEIATLLKTFGLDKLKVELTTLRASHTLMTSENWQLHRASLKDGQPCPLCGSTEHRYHSEEDVQPVIDDMQRLINEKQTVFDAKTAERMSLLQEQSKNEGVINSLKTALDGAAREMDTLRKEWTVLHEAYPDWQEDSESLRQLQPMSKEEIKTAAKRLDDHNALAKNVERLRKAKETAEKALADFIQTAAKQKEKAEQSVNNANTTLVAEKGQTANLLQQVEEKTVAQKAATEAVEQANKETDAKRQALKAETGGADPDVLEQQLTAAKETADKKVKEKSEAILKRQGDLQGLQGKIAATKQAQQNEESAKKEKALALDNWLSSYNSDTQHHQPLTLDDIAQLCSSADDWEQIRFRQKQCGDAFTSAQTTLQNEEKAHKEHLPKAPDADRETLTLRKKELEGLTSEELVTAKARMQRHNEAKTKMGAMFEQMKAAETLMKEWEQIGKAIGKDGDQLRKIAQCYTLRFLIEHANAEIRKFNTRYELQQVKNSLGIRVIDHDRADDVRDTTSLSGGETFIVSLGLALGLSALSSRNISFDNLFIDEGFGTLDPDTLATVIDSLAMLQLSQGKKVGVISHTDTMSERITTQIRIIKHGSGSSHVEIYP